MINELVPRIGVRLGPREGRASPHGFKARLRCLLPLVPLRAARTPQRGYIAAVRGEVEVSCDGVAAVRHRIHLHDAGLGGIPPVHANGNHRNDGALLGRSFSSEVPARSGESTNVFLHRPQAHRPQFVRGDLIVFPFPRFELNVDVLANLRVQVLAARLTPNLPDVLQSRGAVGGEVHGTASRFGVARVARLHRAKPLDARLSPKSRHLDHRIQYPTLAPLISRAVLLQLLPEHPLFVRHIHMAIRYPNYYLPEGFRCLLLLATRYYCLETKDYDRVLRHMADEIGIDAVETDSGADVASLADAQSVRIYEIGYLIVPSVKEEDLEKIVGAVRTEIEKAGGSFIAEGAPSMTRLAYAIALRVGDRTEEHDRGYFGWIKFEARIEGAQALDAAFKGNASRLRSIVFRTVREDTRAKYKAPTLREVKRTDTIKSTPRRVEEPSVAVSEEELDKALLGITQE